MTIRGIESLIEGWDGLAVVCRYDLQTAAWIFVALHDNTFWQEELIDPSLCFW